MNLQKRLMSLILICSLALSCVNVKAEDNQMFEIWPVNEDGERLYYADITIKDTENNQNNSVAVPYLSFYKDYSGDIYAKFSKQTIDGKRYKAKDIRVRKENCYDGACFWGEVKGDNFISYEELTKIVGLPYDKEHIPVIDDGALASGSPYAKKADELDKKEKAVGGIWLKFTDKKYRDKNGNIREFYIAKKPVLKSISWDDLYHANAVYGLDYKRYKYKHKIVKINDKKYVVRLLRGASNYNGMLFGDNIYNKGRGCYHSEWNRTIIPMIKQGRCSDIFSTLENELKDSNNNNDYKIQTASYNWLGDLVLGPRNVINYNGKEYFIADYNGQKSWMQEYNGAAYRVTRGSDTNASGWQCPYAEDNTTELFGWRPVLELIKE